MRKVSEATFVDFGLVGSKGDAFCCTPMYKPSKFGYKGVFDQEHEEVTEVEYPFPT